MLCFAIKLAFDSPGIVRVGPESSVSVGGMVCCHCRRQSLLSDLHEDVATVYVASSSINSWHRSHAITWTLFRACKVRAKIKTSKEGNTERAVLESESWICSQLWPHYCRTCYFSKLMICISIKFFHYSFWIPNWSSFFVVFVDVKTNPKALVLKSLKNFCLGLIWSEEGKHIFCGDGHHVETFTDLSLF